MTDSEYHEIGYSCKWCGVEGRVEIANCCTPEWTERLYVMLCCNNCADIMDTKREAFDAYRSVILRLERNSMTTKDGTRGLTQEERNDLERMRAICRRKLAEITGTLNAARKPLSSAHGNATGTSLRAGQPSQP